MRATTTNGPAPHYHALHSYATWTNNLPQIAGGGHFHRPGARSDGQATVTGPAYYGNGDRLPDEFQHTHHHTEVTA